MMGIQTSAWSTLITPVHIVISTPMIGYDIDLSSPVLQQYSAAYNASKFDIELCILPGLLITVTAGYEVSGYANGQSYVGLPASVSLLGQGFKASTNGILAATLNETNYSYWSIPATAQTVGRLDRGISDSYSMTQQGDAGFTANVSCRLQNLTDATSPGIEQYTDLVSGWTAPFPIPRYTNDGDGNITSLIVVSNCTGGSNLPKPSAMNTTQVLYNGDQGAYLWSVVCDPTPDNPNNYTLILQGSIDYTNVTGPSDTFIVCEIAPTTSVVRVEYSGDADGITGTVESVGPPLAYGGGSAGLFAMLMVQALPFNQQAIGSNGVGNQLLDLVSQVDPDERLTVVEHYVQGIIEYGASVLRGCMYADEMTEGTLTWPMNGTWNTQTLGWKHYSTGTTVWILIPGLFMACSTVALVLVALYRHGGEMQTHTTTFDPSNPLHLMAAAAAGGLNNVFRSLRGRDIHEGGKTTVVLGSVPGRGPALVRADEYAPLSAVSPLAS